MEDANAEPGEDLRPLTPSMYAHVGRAEGRLALRRFRQLVRLLRSGTPDSRATNVVRAAARAYTDANMVLIYGTQPALIVGLVLIKIASGRATFLIPGGLLSAAVLTWYGFRLRRGLQITSYFRDGYRADPLSKYEPTATDAARTQAS